MNRSIRSDVRNPLFGLPSAQAVRELPEEARLALSALLADISADARLRADKCWKKHKAPMAAYWKAVAVYAGHARKLTKSPRKAPVPPGELSRTNPVGGGQESARQPRGSGCADARKKDWNRMEPTHAVVPGGSPNAAGFTHELRTRRATAA